MSKVTGIPITFGKAQALRTKAIGFATDPPIVAALKGISPSAQPDTQTFYNNLDCAFVFDKDSLVIMMEKIRLVPDSGLIMMMGASDDPTTPDPRINKPTLSVFACTITKTDLPNVDDTYAIIHPSPTQPDDTIGVEHPGLVDLKESSRIGGGTVTSGPIKILNM